MYVIYVRNGFSVYDKMNEFESEKAALNSFESRCKKRPKRKIDYGSGLLVNDENTGVVLYNTTLHLIQKYYGCNSIKKQFIHSVLKETCLDYAKMRKSITESNHH